MEDVWGAPGLAIAVTPPVAPTDPVAAANPANIAGKVPG